MTCWRMSGPQQFKSCSLRPEWDSPGQPSEEKGPKSQLSTVARVKTMQSYKPHTTSPRAGSWLFSS